MQGFSPERGGEPQRVWNTGDTGPDSELRGLLVPVGDLTVGNWGVII